MMKQTTAARYLLVALVLSLLVPSANMRAGQNDVRDATKVVLAIASAAMVSYNAYKLYDHANLGLAKSRVPQNQRLLAELETIYRDHRRLRNDKATVQAYVNDDDGFYGLYQQMMGDRAELDWLAAACERDHHDAWRSSRKAEGLIVSPESMRRRIALAKEMLAEHQHYLQGCMYLILLRRLQESEKELPYYPLICGELTPAAVARCYPTLAWPCARAITDMSSRVLLTLKTLQNLAGHNSVYASECKTSALKYCTVLQNVWKIITEYEAQDFARNLGT